MFSTEDTIAAIATPIGRGAIGMVRLSGPDARRLAERVLERRRPLEARLATVGRVRLHGAGIDQVVATWFEGPASYTGEDVVEISAHGSPAVLSAVLDRLVQEGARVARPGEFTLRAYLHGRVDLAQAEAVADLVDAATPMQARVAFAQLEGGLSTRIHELDGELLDLVAALEASLDFPEEGFHFLSPDAAGPRIDGVLRRIDDLLFQAAQGRVIREGATVVIAGRPNVGKSSLFNALVGESRAIVTEWAGTTRDLVVEHLEIGGLAVRLVDTAGLRDTLDGIEREGVARAQQARAAADLTLLVLDGAAPLTPEDERLLDDDAGARVVVASKSDLSEAWSLTGAVRVSARTRDGLDRLRESIVASLTGHESLRDDVVVSNARHVALLRDARHAVARGRNAMNEGASEEFVLADLHAARGHLAEVVGGRASDDVLNWIFERFCVGK